MSEIEAIAHKEGIRRITATSAFGRTRCNRLVYKSTTGHVGGTVGRRLGSCGWCCDCIKYVGYTMGGVKNWVSFVDGWMRPLRGVVTALIDCAHQLFTYPNFSLIRIFHLSEFFTYPNKLLVAVGHRGSDKWRSTVVGLLPRQSSLQMCVLRR